MATITAPEPTTTEPATTEPAPVAVAVGAPVRIMALGLWAIVGSLLLYGVSMTALKAAALFG